MEFKGIHQRIQRQKLPEGLSQEDQNSWHLRQGMWTPRQGLCRPTGLGLSAGRIDAVGFVECGLKTALLYATSSGVVHGDAIGAEDVTLDWIPPPRIHFDYTQPDLGVEFNGTGFDLSWTAPHAYVAVYHIYADGQYLGSTTGTSYSHTTTGTPVYKVIAASENQIASAAGARRRPRAYGDNFNRGALLTGGPFTWTRSGADIEIGNNIVKVNNYNSWMQTPALISGEPMYASFDVWHDNDLSWILSNASVLYWRVRLGTGPPGTGLERAYMEYSRLDDQWRIGALGDSPRSYSAWTSGLPPLSSLRVTMIGNNVTVTYGGKTVTDSGTSMLRPQSARIEVVNTSGGAISDRAGADNFTIGEL
jgi:hypothetical protein